MPAFERAVEDMGSGADWIVAPDIVCGGSASLALSLDWLPRLVRVAPVLLAAQDGMAADDLRPHLSPRVGIFIGGSTEWKLASLPMWGRLAAELGCHLHVGRVNTMRRIRLCALAGTNSFDGTSASRYAVTLPRLDAARRQACIPFDAFGKGA